MAEKEKKMEKKEEKESIEGLPIEDSPYVKYKDLEDYKSKAYGTQGHVPPVTGRGGGATDAPTLSGASVARESDVATIDTIVSRPESNK